MMTGGTPILGNLQIGEIGSSLQSWEQITLWWCFASWLLMRWPCHASLGEIPCARLSERRLPRGLKFFACPIPNWDDAPQVTWCFFSAVAETSPKFAVAWQARYRAYHSISLTTWFCHGLLHSDTTIASVHGCFHVHLWWLLPLGGSRLCEILHPRFSTWHLKGYSMWVVNFQA